MPQLRSYKGIQNNLQKGDINTRSIMRDLLENKQPPRGLKIKLDWAEEDLNYMKQSIDKINKKYAPFSPPPIQA